MLSAIATRAEYWYDQGGDTDGGNSVGVVGDAPGGLKLRRDPPACADLGAAGEVVCGGAGADDERFNHGTALVKVTAREGATMGEIRP